MSQIYFFKLGDLQIHYKAGKTDWKGRLSVDHLHVFSSLDLVLLTLKVYFLSYTKTGYLSEEVNHTEPSPLLWP